jgi:hypothetical protein
MYLQFETRPVDAEFVHLMHDLQSTEIVGHKYRGYTLLTQHGHNLRSIKVSMQLNTVVSLSRVLDQYIILWNSLLPYYTSYILCHSFPTVWLPAHTSTPLSTKVLPTVQCAVDMLSMCGIEQLNWVQLQLESCTLKWLRLGFQNGRLGGDSLISKLIFGMCFHKFLSAALTSAGSTAFWLFYHVTLTHRLFQVLWL